MKLCKTEGCGRPVSPYAGFGLCQRCYDRLRHTREKNYAFGKCKIEGCKRPAHRRGLCKSHSEQVRLHGKITHKELWSPDGRRKHPLWKTWASMVSRCRYDAGYVKKGITVCERWQGRSGFYRFIEDMGDKPSKWYSLDRIDNSKGYSPENCRWACPHVQSINRDVSTDLHNIVIRPHKDGSVSYFVYMRVRGEKLYKKANSLDDAFKVRAEMEELWQK